MTPVSFPPDRAPPINLVDNLTQFDQKFGGLTSGCVSSAANVFAVLEYVPGEKRRVQILSLRAHENGGIHCPENRPVPLDFTLQGKDEAPPCTPCAIRFDEGGRRLFAADFQGRIYITELVQS